MTIVEILLENTAGRQVIHHKVYYQTVSKASIDKDVQALVAEYKKPHTPTWSIVSDDEKIKDILSKEMEILLNTIRNSQICYIKLRLEMNKFVTQNEYK